jgi:hypothetical protein
VLLGQNLSSASGLLGKTIAGLDDAGKNITGAVDSVFIEKGNAKAVVGNSIVSLKNIGQILPN